MWYDDLNAPLGQNRVQARQSRGKAIILAALLGGGGLIATIAPSLLEQIRPPAAAASNDANISRLAGTVSQKSAPSADKDKPPLLSDLQEESVARRPLHLPSASELDSLGTAGTEAIEKQTGVKILRAGGGGAPEALVIDVAKALGAGSTAAADPRIIEQSRYGPIPRIGVDGARPSKVYSRPHPPPGDSRIRHASRWL